MDGWVNHRVLCLISFVPHMSVGGTVLFYWNIWLCYVSGCSFNMISVLSLQSVAQDVIPNTAFPLG